jgi:prolyl-tRNA synthetase
MDLLRKNINSYQDLPVSLYHFSTKFRNELRAKSGILRGREFMMKDLYSAHASEEDLMAFYEKVKQAYSKIFTRLGFNFKIAEASGGVFTTSHTHEFQVLTDVGEDTIYWKQGDEEAVNEEILEGNKEDYMSAKCIEVGNIFPLGTWYAEKMGVTFTDQEGNKKPVWFGSYGIGPTRVMGTLVEVSHDDRGIIWYPQVAPFRVHLIGVKEQESQMARDIYEKLQKTGIEVLYDDRNISVGQKFSDADLIGIPLRAVISERNGEKIEVKERSSEDIKLLQLEEFLSICEG